MAESGTDWGGIIATLLKTGGQVLETVEQNSIARRNQEQQDEQYKRLAALQDPNTLFQKVMQFKKNLSAQEQSMISRTIAANLVAGGAGGATGIIEEAIADALMKADSELFAQATSAVLSASGMASGVLQKSQLAKSQGGGIIGSLTDLEKLIPKTKTKATEELPKIPEPTNTFGSWYGSVPSLPPDGGE